MTTLFVLVSAGLSCGGGGASAGGPSAAAGGDTCQVTLTPGDGTAIANAPPAPFDVPRSTLVVHAELPVAAIERELEAKVPRRVAEEKDVDIGMAGRLEYTVDRGGLHANVDGDALVVDAPLAAHARACAKGTCYAGCDPEARLTARVPLHLGADYKLQSVTTHLDITRGCQVRALGGLLNVDVTPILMARLPKAASGVDAAIAKELPSFRPDAERAWKELSAPRALPLGACVVLAPEEIVQGKASGSGQTARLLFGLRARPELRGACGAPPRVMPLPPLKDDPSLADDGDVHLAVVLAGSGPSAVLEGTAIDFAGGSRGVVRHAAGTAPAMDLELGSEVCGAIRGGATGAAWTTDGVGVHLTGFELFTGEADRLTKAGLDASAVPKAIEAVPLPSPVSAGALATILPELARSASDTRADVTARVISAAPESAGLRGESVVEVIHLRGALTAKMK